MLQESTQSCAGNANGATAAVKVAGAYIRVSTDEQAQSGYSIPSQIEACTRFAKETGYLIPHEGLLIDDGYTGTTMERPGLRKLQHLIRDRAIEAVIVYDPDRLSRNLGHQLLLAEEMDRCGVKLLIVSHPLERGPEGWLFFQLRGAVAEYERAKMLERTQRGQIQRAKSGRPPGSITPLGYRYISDDHQAGYEIVEDEAIVIQRIFRMCLDGVSCNAIAKALTAERIPTKGDRSSSGLGKQVRGLWYSSTVHAILKNETYAGRYHYNKRQRGGESRYRDKSLWVEIAVPEIVDEGTFQAVQNQLQRNAVLSPRRRKYEYLFLGGRLRCGLCGRAMSGYKTGPPTAKLRYRCSRPKWQAIEIPRCNKTVRAQDIEQQVWGAVERLLQNPNLIAQAVEQQRLEASKRQDDLDNEQRNLKAALARCEKDLKRWEAAYIGEAITLEDFKSKKAEIDARQESLKAEQERQEAQAKAIQEAEIETATLIEFCKRVRRNLGEMTIADKRLAFEALGIQVTWYPDRKNPEIQATIDPEMFSIASGTPWLAI